MSFDKESMPKHIAIIMDGNRRWARAKGIPINMGHKEGTKTLRIIFPLTVPANISSVIYVQMRMIACTAYMAGYDLHCDQVQSLVYACLAGVAVNSVFKKTGIKLGEKMAVSVIQKIPRNVITRINQRVGFLFITKFGEKGLINLGKLVPGVGALINGGFDFAETKVIANRSYSWFFEGDFSVDEQNTHQEDEPNILDIDDFSEA